MREKIRIPSLVWKDSWFQKLSVNEKLFFLYLLSNPHSLMCGIYSGMTKKRMRIDTGFDENEIEHILKKFRDDSQVFYDNETIEIVNSIRFYDNYQKLRLTPQYKSWRKAVLKRDNYTCQMCGGKSTNLHVHHIKAFSKYSLLQINIQNGITLCETCHRTLHKGETNNG